MADLPQYPGQVGVNYMRSGGYDERTSAALFNDPTNVGIVSKLLWAKTRRTMSEFDDNSQFAMKGMTGIGREILNRAFPGFNLGSPIEAQLAFSHAAGNAGMRVAGDDSPIFGRQMVGDNELTSAIAKNWQVAMNNNFFEADGSRKSNARGFNISDLGVMANELALRGGYSNSTPIRFETMRSDQEVKERLNDARNRGDQDDINFFSKARVGDQYIRMDQAAISEMVKKSESVANVLGHAKLIFPHHSDNVPALFQDVEAMTGVPLNGSERGNDDTMRRISGVIGLSERFSSTPNQIAEFQSKIQSQLMQNMTMNEGISPGIARSIVAGSIMSGTTQGLQIHQDNQAALERGVAVRPISSDTASLVATATNIEAIRQSPDLVAAVKVSMGKDYDLSTNPARQKEFADNIKAYGNARSPEEREHIAARLGQLVQDTTGVSSSTITRQGADVVASGLSRPQQDAINSAVRGTVSDGLHEAMKDLSGVAELAQQGGFKDMDETVDFVQDFLQNVGSDSARSSVYDGLDAKESAEKIAERLVKGGFDAEKAGMSALDYAKKLQGVEKHINDATQGARGVRRALDSVNVGISADPGLLPILGSDADKKFEKDRAALEEEIKKTYGGINWAKGPMDAGYNAFMKGIGPIEAERDKAKSSTGSALETPAKPDTTDKKTTGDANAINAKDIKGVLDKRQDGQYAQNVFVKNQLTGDTLLGSVA